MKSFTKFILALSAVCILSVLCTSASAFGAEKSSKTYEVDLTQFIDWYNGANFDKKNNLFTTKKEGGCIGLGLWDVKKGFLLDYNCLVIDYTAHNYGFFLSLIYEDAKNPQKKIEDKVYCPSNLSQFVVPFTDKNLSDYNLSIELHDPWHHAANVTINKITLEKRDNPELSKSYKVPVAQAPIDNGPVKELDDSLSAWDFLPKMGAGIQYSIAGGFDYENDFGIDACYAWGYPKETKETIHEFAKRGFKTLRLQVSGNFHVIDSDYTMDPEFIALLKRVVDWAIEEDMYVVICEGCCSYYYPESVDKEKNKFVEEKLFGAGYCINREYKDRSEKYLKAFWTQIAAAFNNSYDEHLVFEFINEPIDLTDHTWHPLANCDVCKEDVQVLNELNQTILNTIRATGGNNAKRYLMVPTLGQDPWPNDIKNFKLPNDTSKNKLIVSVHTYPMGCNPDEKDEYGNITKPGDIAKYYTPVIKNNFEKMFSQLDKTFFKNKIPVSFTEVTCSRITNSIERINCMTDFMNEVNKKGRNCTAYLHTNTDIYLRGDGFGYYDLETNTWYDNEYIDTLLNLAARKENKISDDYIKNNGLHFSSVVGQNILEKEMVSDSYSFNDIKYETFYKRLPKKFKLEFTYEVIPNSSETYLSYYYFNPEKNNKKTFLFTENTIKGGFYNSWSDGANIILDGSGKLTLSFTEKTAQPLEWYNTSFECCGIILKSIKVIE